MPRPNDAFSGFLDETLGFLRELENNNTRDWFKANRSRYDEHVLAPACQFVEETGRQLQAIAPTIQFEPSVNGSIFRQHRDVRFAKDKTPYKTHLDIWFWEGEGRGWDNPGFFFRFGTEALVLGCGLHKFGPATLAAYREAVVDPVEGQALAEALTLVESAGPYQLGGERLKRPPRGYDPEHERADLLKQKGLYMGMEGPLPSTAFTRKLVDYCVAHYRNLAPLHQWLTRLVARARS